MSIRINKAIGYGMPWSDFIQNTVIEDSGEGLNESLYNTLNSISEMPKPSEKEFSKFSLNESQYCHFEILDGREGGSLYDLCHTTGYDYTEHIIFLPCHHFLKWYRYSDAIDWTEERWFGSDGRNDVSGRLEDTVRYLGYGHYPFSNNLMHPDGSHKPWKHFSELYGTEEIYPACPPGEIVYWTQKAGVLTREGVLKLRPILATWWS